MTISRDDCRQLTGPMMVPPEDRDYLMARAESALAYLRACRDPLARRLMLHAILCYVWAESRAEAQGHAAWERFLLGRPPG